VKIRQTAQPLAGSAPASADERAREVLPREMLPGAAGWRARVEADLERLFGAAGARPQTEADPAQIRRFRAQGGRVAPLAPVTTMLRRRGREPAIGSGTEDRLVYAVGDVHGRYDLLLGLLEEILRDMDRQASRRPVLVFLGDYVDRGPDSGLVLEALIWLAQRAPADVCLLKGNHEQGLLDFLETPVQGGPWLQFGGYETLAAYGVARPDELDPADFARARDDLLAAMPASHLRLLQGLDLMALIGGYVFVHAGLVPGRPLASQREIDLLWIRGAFLEAGRACDGVVVHGHTWSGPEPEFTDHRIGVDTGAYATGVLTAVRLDGDERRVLQARDAKAGSPARPAAASPRLVSRPVDFRENALSVNLALGAAGAPWGWPAVTS
jgi:serine/threonine protein phosphatase 1